VLAGGLVHGLVVAGSIAAWAEVSGGSTGYRMATVTRADIGTTLTVVGSVAPVTDAAPSFQVGGRVSNVAVSPGESVTAGETLASLDTTALSESVSSAQSTLNADEAKLAEDEASQSAGSSSSGNSASGNSSSGSTSSGSHPPASTTPSSTTPTTAPSHGGGGSSGGESAVISQDQATLTQDQTALSVAQQQEAADLAQSQNDCKSVNTSTPAGQATCEADLETVSSDEQHVSADQATVSHDETVLAQALASAAAGSGSSSPGATGNSGSSPTQGGKAVLSASFTGTTGNTGPGGTSSPGGTGGTGSAAGNGSSNTDTPAQIASDQAAIDTAQANLTEAQQSLAAATLTSPISGTVVSVGINVGDTVSAGSATEIITIIGTKAYEVQATLTSSQIPSVKTGQSASVEVDGVDGVLHGTVSQVGPVQSTSNGYTYPVIVALPGSAGGMYSGSSANVVISTGEVSRVVAVPTSAVETLGARSYVLELSNGQLTRKFVKVGMVGDTYTQVVSGLTPGQNVVLVDYAESVPSSNTNSLGGLGSFLGGGGGNNFGGPGAFFFGRGGGGSRSISGQFGG
jgi:HlyD family secretion protein